MRIGICAVQVPFTIGGAENHTLGLYNELIKRGYEVEYINIPFKWYPPNEIIKYALIWRMLDLTESNGRKIDLLICTRFPSYVIKHPNKVVWLLHQFRQAYELYDTPYSDLKTTKEGEIIREKIIKVDNKTISECKKIYTNSKNVSYRLKRYNGIIGKPLYHPPKYADKFYCGDFDNYVICPSRIESIKRQYLLIESLRYVKTGARVLIVGKGPQEKEYVSLAKKLKVEDRIQFCGHVPEDKLIDLYANSLSIFYAPYDEDYGYVTIESFLSRKPVITTCDAGGPLEFVDNNVNGYILDTNPEEIAKKIDYLFENRAVAKEMGLQGYNKMKDMDITWDRVIKELVG